MFFKRIGTRMMSIGCLMLLLGACDGPAEKAGEELDQSVEEVREEYQQLRQELVAAREELKRIQQERDQARQELEQAKLARQQALETMEVEKPNPADKAPAAAPASTQ